MDRPDSGSVSPGRYAPHLSEFYSIVNNTSPSSSDGMVDGERRGSHSMAAPSMTSNFSSISDLRTLVTKRDIKNTVDALQGLLDSSRAYNSSLQEVSRNASLMGHSLENLARLKGCSDDSAEKLLSASGLFYLLANHENIMSQCLKGVLGESLLDKIDQFKVESKKMENEFKSHAREESLKLKIQERHNLKLAQRRTRNLVSYKESLVNLQSQLDQLESLRHDYYQDSYNLVESTCAKVLDAVATVSRARVEISENVARKGWSGGGLDDLLMDAEDPFNKEDSTINEGQSEGEETIEDDNLKKGVASPQFSTAQPHNEMESEAEHDHSHENEDRDDDEDDGNVDPDADNSFSLPLAGSSRSREPPIENDDES
ncbi:ZYRO0A09966p [Zygosaccharomyces rouxii]|uniref:ZYRO0A09966p n=1 Tax=Zygosaccharomyces rouxii (strain ATCC 2623 / CBS 732 / NBRC 1130 / NCYC 568 / NRRL Y-229) TaxID=559307 RepID=C5DQA6_ZYGRC|nr:uncharacterized protein ZYRO0A09966g [Zygosaccharomyces rouxii]KAH9198614.1 hypothetical protein LQ764DRAFT_139210 [Zygosaccharomyces rouxii]CAR25867.1 ZYRO0A09966p [Zygosaccharomyces rouxii]